MGNRGRKGLGQVQVLVPGKGGTRGSQTAPRGNFQTRSPQGSGSLWGLLANRASPEHQAMSGLVPSLPSPMVAALAAAVSGLTHSRCSLFRTQEEHTKQPFKEKGLHLSTQRLLPTASSLFTVMGASSPSKHFHRVCGAPNPNLHKSSALTLATL